MIKIPDEILLELAGNLSKFRAREEERRRLVERTATMFGCSVETVYRQLARLRSPRRCTRSDQGRPRNAAESDFRRWVEIVAAVKLATRNKKGRHLSTGKAIELAEEGVYIEGRFEQIPKGKLLRSNCDRWMGRLGISIRHSLRQTPAIRFEARESNECWQFDISVSDAHYLAEQKPLPETGQSGWSRIGSDVVRQLHIGHPTAESEPRVKQTDARKAGFPQDGFVLLRTEDVQMCVYRSAPALCLGGRDTRCDCKRRVSRQPECPFALALGEAGMRYHKR